jgi:hypothetical protein
VIGGLRAPGDPTPTPTPPGGIDWTKIHPDINQLPKPELFYHIASGLLALGIFAAVGGLIAGAMGFGIGPLFGAHIVSDRGKSMMWKAGLIAVIVGSGTSIVAFLLKQAS